MNNACFIAGVGSIPRLQQFGAQVELVLVGHCRVLQWLGSYRRVDFNVPAAASSQDGHYVRCMAK
jgi:hypothetical protein